MSSYTIGKIIFAPADYNLLVGGYLLLVGIFFIIFALRVDVEDSTSSITANITLLEEKLNNESFKVEEEGTEPRKLSNTYTVQPSLYL